MGTPDGGDRLINGRYRLIEVIGRGGMGTVWHGHDEMLDREVAIKEVTLSPDLDDEERAELSALAMQEARATARLSHPGIITIFDVIDDEGVPIIVMELLKGHSLAAVLKEQVRLPYRRVAEIGAAMLDALREAHAAGIVHRDLKPANVLITDRRIVLTDFGVAQRVGEHADEPGDVTGTPAFMAPEQAENAAASPAADLWALGATLFNAVEGKPPYEGPDYVTVLLTLLTQEPPAPVRAGPLAPVISALLRKDPARRPSADQVAEQLATILRDDDGGAAAKPVPAVKPPAATPPKAAVPSTRSQAAPTPKPATSSPAYIRPGARRSPAQRGTAAIIAAVLSIGLLVVYAVTRTGSPASSSGISASPDDSFVPSVAPTNLPGTSTPTPSRVFKATALSPDGSAVAFGGDSGVVRVYDTATHKSRRSLKATSKDETIAALGFSPDGRTIAAELNGGTVDVWDLGTHKKPRTFDSEDVGNALGFSSDGRTLMVLGTAGHVAMWNVGTGKRTSARIRLPLGALCLTMALSPNGHDAACGYYNGTDTNDDNGGVVVWDARKDRQVASWSDADPSNVLAFSPDGRTLAFPGKTENVLQLWDVASRRQTGEVDASVIASGNALAFSPDGRTLAVPSVDTDSHQDIIGLWKAGKKVATLPGTEGLLHSMALGPGARTLATATDDGGILWSVKSHKQLASWTG